jgi:phosphohistidine phosphatase
MTGLDPECHSIGVIDSPRRLVVMRHARAGQVDTRDIDRPLADAGVADARNTGVWLAGLGVRPDGALVSAAERAVSTFAAVSLGAGWDLVAQVDRGLYTADEQTALDLVRLIGDDVRTLVVVGHNPTMATLAFLLDDGEGDPQVGLEMASGFTPASAAVFEYAGSWALLDFATARLTAYHAGPR